MNADPVNSPNNPLISCEVFAGAIPRCAPFAKGVDTEPYPYKLFALTACFSDLIKSVARTSTLL
ncbi:hypothetical protein ON021_13930, partial [Microcoleus sp. HI-ES]|nr:hypothetical protein [Microcoleus sp. HI-ES]